MTRGEIARLIDRLPPAAGEVCACTPSAFAVVLHYPHLHPLDPVPPPPTHCPDCGKPWPPGKKFIEVCRSPHSTWHDLPEVPCD
jgi:hypothetical protein